MGLVSGLERMLVTAQLTSCRAENRLGQLVQLAASDSSDSHTTEPTVGLVNGIEKVLATAATHTLPRASLVSRLERVPETAVTHALQMQAWSPGLKGCKGQQ